MNSPNEQLHTYILPPTFLFQFVALVLFMFVAHHQVLKFALVLTELHPCLRTVLYFTEEIFKIVFKSDWIGNVLLQRFKHVSIVMYLFCCVHHDAHETLLSGC